MKNTNFLKIAFISLITISAITAQEDFNVEIEPVSINGAPAIHSYSWGKTSDDKWIILGGRIDGLHQRQPFSAFPDASNNKNIFVIDPVSNQTWSSSLSSLPASVFEQLQATNQEFFQREDMLYVIGGYGYSATINDHVTYAHLTAIDVDGLANAVINSSSITPFFRQILDSNMAVTGGQLGYLDSTFYLAGGQYFEGRYNPQGPNNGPGFIQQYTEEVRKFKIVDDGVNLSITNYTTDSDPANLHRRDYNMTPQIFPNGEHGFTVWAGVFDPNDLPYLNSVDVTATGHAVNNNFTQYLSQYHSAKIPVSDAASNTMHTLFFGGMSQYTLDVNGAMVQDDNVPFVKTISKVSRLADGTMQEVKLNIEMPTLLGSGAEFIPISDTTLYYNKEILKINEVPNNKTLIGYIYGGIESSLPNIFFINDGTQSSASNIIFKVFINKSTVGLHEVLLDGDNIFNLTASPNPVIDHLKISFFKPDNLPTYLDIYNVLGEQIESIKLPSGIGSFNTEIDMHNYASGQYVVVMKGINKTSQQIIIKD